MEFLVAVLVIGGIIWIYRNSQKNKLSYGFNWKQLKQDCKYCTLNGNWKIALDPAERKLYLRDPKQGEKAYDFGALRSFRTNKTNVYLYLTMKDVDHTEWMIGLGAKECPRWQEIIRQEIFGQ